MYVDGRASNQLTDRSLLQATVHRLSVSQPSCTRFATCMQCLRERTNSCSRDFLIKRDGARMTWRCSRCRKSAPNCAPQSRIRLKSRSGPRARRVLANSSYPRFPAIWVVPPPSYEHLANHVRLTGTYHIHRKDLLARVRLRTSQS